MILDVDGIIPTTTLLPLFLNLMKELNKSFPGEIKLCFTKMQAQISNKYKKNMSLSPELNTGFRLDMPDNSTEDKHLQSFIFDLLEPSDSMPQPNLQLTSDQRRLLEEKIQQSY